MTGLIARLGEIHRQEKAFCHGVYRELYLTNRQYAYSRENGDSLVLTALNNDPGPAALSIPLPPEITRALPLLGEEGKPESMEPIAVENGRLNITLPGNWGSILKLV